MDIEVVTFDCYGTLIDWETGIRSVFEEFSRGRGLDKTWEEKTFTLYEQEERRIESLSYRPYRRVLAEAFDAAVRTMGLTIRLEESSKMAEQLPKWRPFGETNPALRRLSSKYSLGILSNVDDDLLSGTLENFAVSFDTVVTAEKVRSYKPRPKHFLKAREIIDGRSWLHVASSLYHDIEPALKLGIDTVWVNRTRSSEGRRFRGRIVREFEDLAQLAEWLVPTSVP